MNPTANYNPQQALNNVIQPLPQNLQPLPTTPAPTPIGPVATPTPPASTVITKESLIPQPEMTVTAPKPTMGYTGLSGVIESQANNFVAEQKAEADTQLRLASERAKVEGSKQTLKDRVFGAKTQSGLQVDAYKTEVDPAKRELNDINNQILQEQVGLRRQIEDMEKNRGNLPIESLNQEINRAKTESIRRQADLSIVQLAKQGKYELAKEMADRSITAELEQEKNVLDVLKFDYESNKETYTKEEQREHEKDLKAGDRAYAEKVVDKKLISDLSISALEGGAPASVASQMRTAKNVQDAITLGGSYIGSLDRQKKILEISKLNKEIAATGIPAITNPTAAQYKGALGVILGSGTFTKDQKASIVAGINNGNDPFTVVKNQAKNIMGQALATDLDKIESAKAQIESIDTLMDQYYQNGGSTNIFSGNYEKVVNKLGTLNDPKLVGIATQIALAMQEYRLAVTGTAASIQEDSRIDAIFPGINSTKGLNEAKTNALISSFDQKIDAKYRNTLGPTYDELKKANSSSNIQAVSNIDYTATLDNIFK